MAIGSMLVGKGLQNRWALLKMLIVMQQSSCPCQKRVLGLSCTLDSVCVIRHVFLTRDFSRQHETGSKCDIVYRYWDCTSAEWHTS